MHCVLRIPPGICLKISRNDFKQPPACLDRSPCNVRSQYDIPGSAKRRVGRHRFLRQHIQCCRGNDSFIQRAGKVALVDDSSAGSVDQKRRFLDRKSVV